MPIEVYTGKPGNGKTAFMVKRLLAEAAKKEGRRPLFAAGIDGLAPGLATVLDNPTQWNRYVLDPEGSCKCGAADLVEKDAKGVEVSRTKRPHRHDLVPDGSLVFIDEAWKWFGHLHDASRQATPAHVLDLAEHRHRGIDFVWTTQGPNQLYPFVRPLCADHYHHVRRFGTQFVDVFHWQELQEDVKSTTRRESAQHSLQALPKEAFGQYKSAEVHTIKRRLPLKLLAIPAIVVGIALCSWAAYASLRPEAQAERMSTGTAATAGAVEAGRVAASVDGPMTATTWAERFVPRISGIPASAPAYDDRQVVSYPQVACGIGATMGCRCFTEQGTRYEMDQEQCATLVQEGGVYDPFKAPSTAPVQATEAPPAPLADDLAALGLPGV